LFVQHFLEHFLSNINDALVGRDHLIDIRDVIGNVTVELFHDYLHFRFLNTGDFMDTVSIIKFLDHGFDVRDLFFASFDLGVCLAVPKFLFQLGDLCLIFISLSANLNLGN